MCKNFQHQHTTNWQKYQLQHFFSFSVRHLQHTYFYVQIYKNIQNKRVWLSTWLLYSAKKLLKSSNVWNILTNKFHFASSNYHQLTVSSVFTHNEPSVWNVLPEDVHSESDNADFRKLLTTILSNFWGSLVTQFVAFIPPTFQLTFTGRSEMFYNDGFDAY